MTEPRPGGVRRLAIALVTHSYYEEDPRVRRQAETLVHAGWAVDVFSLRRVGDPRESRLAGVRVHHLNVRRHQGASLRTYLAEYVAFFLRAAVALLHSSVRRRYSVVQVASLPDWLVFAAAPLRLVGVAVVLDLHEAMPEFFRSRFPSAARPIIYHGLLLQERASIAAATQVITVNDALAERLLAIGIPRHRLSVVPNTPSLTRFDPARHAVRPFMADGVLRLLYAGALTPTYELDVAVRALATLRSLRPELKVHLDLYGRGDSRSVIESLIVELGIGVRVTFRGRIPIEDVPAAMAAADIGLAPTRRDHYTDASLSTKIFEYAAMGKPAIASRLPMVERTFPSEAILLYEPGSPTDLARQIELLVDDPNGREARIITAGLLVRERSWEIDSRAYLALLERLSHGRRARSRRPSG
jgi:glycosyltransferase involved in cell wall biosynthesis